MERIGRIIFTMVISMLLIWSGFGSLIVSAADWKKPVYTYG